MVEMKFAIGGIAHETNTFSTLRTSIDDFHILRGDEILNDKFWSSYGEVEWAPTILATAYPHGLVEKGTYLNLKEELLDRLKSSLPVDGIFLDLHGSMEIEEIGDGEGDLSMAVREVVGAETPIVASLDLHGNISHELARNVNILTALRTAPHQDWEQTRERAVKHLIRCAKKEIRPVNVLLKLPLILPGEFAVTDAEPASSLYGKLEDLDREEGLLDGSIMIGCAWTDSPRTSVSVIVVAEDEEHEAEARKRAMALAQDIWTERRNFAPEVETVPVEEAVDIAMRAQEGPVFISDSGDNVTAGGAGDVPFILDALLRSGATEAVIAGITDSQAVSACARGKVGSEFSLCIGGKLDRVNGYPLEIKGTIQYVHPTRLAVIKVNGIEVVLISDRRAFTTLQDFEEAGVDPLRRKIIVVKLGYLFPEIRKIARKAIMALSPGFTTLEIEKLPYERIKRPIFPLDRDCNFELL
ncbi:MAG: M81 family metallopeptidase [Thermoproteota archaeon]